MLALALLATGAFAQEDASPKKWAVVTYSSNFIREEAGYDAEMATQALMGTVVEVLENKGWTKIRTSEPYVAYVSRSGLKMMTEAEKDAYLEAEKYICTVEYTHIFTEPDAGSRYVCDFIWGDLVLKTGIKKGKWIKVLIPSGKEGWVLKSEVQDFRNWVDTREPNGGNILNTAYKFLGVSYMWGGTSIKHVDCSGLSRSVYFLNGILLPRNASQQAKVGVEVPYEEAQPGDLIFWGRAATADKPERVSHVTIYMGDDHIIHSASNVHISSLRPTEEEDYYNGTRLHVRRILGNVDNGTGITSIAASPYYFKK